MNDLEVFTAWLKKNEFELNNQIHLHDGRLFLPYLKSHQILLLEKFSSALNLIEEFHKSTINL